MKTLDVRKLIDNKAEYINVSSDVLKIYKVWKNMFRKHSDIKGLDAFYAGYVLSNPVLRDKVKKLVLSNEVEIINNFN